MAEELAPLAIRPETPSDRITHTYRGRVIPVRYVLDQELDDLADVDSEAGSDKTIFISTGIAVCGVAVGVLASALLTPNPSGVVLGISSGLAIGAGLFSAATWKDYFREKAKARKRSAGLVQRIREQSVEDRLLVAKGIAVITSPTPPVP